METESITSSTTSTTATPGHETNSLTSTIPGVHREETASINSFGSENTNTDSERVSFVHVEIYFRKFKGEIHLRTSLHVRPSTYIYISENIVLNFIIFWSAKYTGFFTPTK